MWSMRNDGSCRVLSLLTAAIFMGSLIASPVAYAKPPEGKGKGNQQAQGKGKGKGQQQAKSQGKSKGSSASANRSSVAATKVDRSHPHQQRNNRDLADRGTGVRRGSSGRTKLAQLPQAAQIHRPAHAGGGRDAARVRVDGLLKSLNKLEKGKKDKDNPKFEKSRWHFNPHDERGQGNNGKPDMRAPYGHDKDSGREKSDRGRPIREAEVTLNLEELVTNFEVVDPRLAYLRELLERYRALADTYSWYRWYVTWLESYVANYTSYSTYDKVRVNMDDAIYYTFDLGTQEGFEGTTLLVTTQLVSVNDYDSTVFNNLGSNWWADRTTRDTVHYDAGEVVVEETQEVTLGEDGTFTFNYDVPDNLVGTGNYFEMAVTVTEPESGTSYTMTYDRQLYLYRCPYGIIYNKKTGKPIVGATVTIHNADGSVVMLDKASNPNVSNPQTTDATGRYNAKLAIGKKYYLSVKATGYDEYRSPLFSERWHIVREDVALAPAAIIAKK